MENGLILVLEGGTNCPIQTSLLKVSALHFLSWIFNPDAPGLIHLEELSSVMVAQGCAIRHGPIDEPVIVYTREFPTGDYFDEASRHPSK